MALNTQIDALLTEATAQGLTIEQLLVQVSQRNNTASYPDEFPTFSTSTFMDPGDWPDAHDYMAEATTMPFEIAWSRMWAGFVGEEQGIALTYMMQVARVLNTQNRFNAALPNLVAKSKVLPAQAIFNF